ncbi:DUF4878 domain-containing protein [Deminuibacter soli]|uniref:DUF4878 domain-containing protein n=1 Tax=Deminuibacter soli TaxID=2291815 RepID=A0A3E1NIF5_9BACT|nr:DUF4878 domain-containing protein [Deminuibacter soli]RFM27710.1 DUF4878 domain-containing protein [Deminuibacter soli]
MKKMLIGIFVLLAVTSCGGEKFEPADNALDAGRFFIEGCLKGDFDKAAFYILPDDVNRQDLNQLQKHYKENGKAKNAEYKKASIYINNLEELNDSTTVINYANSYDKIARKLRVIRKGTNWQVDLKYTFNGNL